jgi:hypothetical protein
MKYWIVAITSMAGLVLSCNAQISKQTTSEDREYPEKIRFTVKNASPLERKDAVVDINLDLLKKKYPAFNPQSMVVFVGKEVPSQCNDLNRDGKPDQLLLITNLGPGEKKMVEIRYNKTGSISPVYPNRTQAELSIRKGGNWENRKYIGGVFVNVNSLLVPPEHTDHSSYIRYEGPGWESDLVGYRFYLDWRNAIDLFGKKTSAMVLQNVGQDGFDSYHEMGDWGMDILKVGNSLGIGTLATWHDGKANRVAVTDSIFSEVLYSGPVQSMIRTHYYGWKTATDTLDLISELSITAGSRLTKHHVVLSKPIENLCTGIVRLDSTRILEGSQSTNWNFLATYGKQSLAFDSLGLAVIYKNSILTRVTGDKDSHVVVFSADENELNYFLLGAWEKEPGGIRNGEAFRRYLDNCIQDLNHPLEIEY